MTTTTQITPAVEEYLREQPWFTRRKDTILAVAGGVLQVAQIATAYTTDAPTWVPILVGAIIMVAQAVIHAATPGAVTPSMAPRLEQAFENSQPVVDTSGCVADDFRYGAELPPYSGRHRLDGEE